jgi:hypothetical protein
MNPELLLSFAVMQGLAPAGSTVPVEAIFTSSDAMPAWARFALQVHLVQSLQADLQTCRAKSADLAKHHHESHEKTAAFEAEVRTLCRVVHDCLKNVPGYHEAVAQLRTRGDMTRVFALYDAETRA